ncbi:MAG: NAD(P)-dependent oxidoreductase [Gaiellaceae bacterium]
MTRGTLDLAVIGGGGMIGSRIVTEALDRGHNVTLVVRDPSKVTESHERLTVIRGDVLDGSIADLVEGRDVVVSAVGTARAEDPDYSLYLNAARSLVDASRRLADTAPRLIVVGGVGSLVDSSGHAILKRVPEERLPEHLGQKTALDYYVTVADVQWTYLSPPGRIGPGERTGAYRIGGDELLVDEHGESNISMEDYAVAVLDEAERPRHVGRRFTVGH